eukprot:gene26708-32274_t
MTYLLHLGEGARAKQVQPHVENCFSWRTGEALRLRKNVSGAHGSFLKRHLTLFGETKVGDLSDSAEISPTALLLMPKDYPKAFRGYAPGTKKYAHPDDYKEDNVPVKPEIFLYKSGDGHNRIFMRVSSRTTPDGDENVKFTSATFILDTRCCHDLEVCEDLGRLLTHRWKKDSVHDYIKIQIENDTHMCYIKSDLPEGHKLANVMGLPVSPFSSRWACSFVPTDSTQ